MPATAARNCRLSLAARALRLLVVPVALGLAGCTEVAESPDALTVTWSSSTRWVGLGGALGVMGLLAFLVRRFRGSRGRGARWPQGLLVCSAALAAWFVPKLFCERVVVTSEEFRQETVHLGVPVVDSFSFREVDSLQVDFRRHSRYHASRIILTLVDGGEKFIGLTSLAVRSRDLWRSQFRRHGVRIRSANVIARGFGRASDEPLAVDMALGGRVFVDRGSPGDQLTALFLGGHAGALVRSSGGPSLRAALDGGDTLLGTWQTTLRSGPRDVTLLLTFMADGTFRYVARDASGEATFDGTYEISDLFLSFRYAGGVSSWQRRTALPSPS